MRPSTRTAMMAVASVLVCGSAHADLVGLTVFREGLYGSATPVEGPLWIYRVYAEFTEPTDGIALWGVGSSLGPGYISNVTVDANPGSGFNNIPDNDTGNLAPSNPLQGRDWDTYMTIGVLYGSLGPGGLDYTEASVNLPTFIPHGSTLWTADTAYVRIPPPFTQGRADHITSIGNDNDRRVLLMQLVVNEGQHVQGTIGLIWRNQTTGFIVQGLTFSSIPAPSAAIVVVVGTIVRNGRHRIQKNDHVCRQSL